MIKLQGKRSRSLSYSDLKWHCDLVEYEGPLLSLYHAENRSLYLSMWVDRDNTKSRWIVFRVSAKSLREYFETEISLYSLLKTSSQVFKLDISRSGRREFKGIELHDLPHAYFPAEDTFFDKEFATEAANRLAEEKGTDYYINIDGDWFLEDWSEVPHLYKQVYAFNHSLRNLRTPDIAKRIKPTLTHLPFRGGFSIVHMLNSMHDAIPPISRVRVESIVYHSPGHIGLRVDQVVAKEIENVMLLLSDDEQADKIRESYRACRKFLVEEGLATLNADEFNVDSYDDFEDVAQMIKDNLTGLLTTIGYQADIPFLVTDEAPLPMMKTILAYVKRLLKLHEYVEKGLISQFGGVPRDN